MQNKKQNLTNKLRTGFKGALLTGVIGLSSLGAQGQEYSFDNPQQYVEVRNINDIPNSEYAPFTPVNGGEIDDSQYMINDFSYKTPVEEGMGEENYLVHGEEGNLARELFENFTKETGDNYNPNHLVVKLGEGEFKPGTNSPIVSRPTRFIGTYENGEHLSELITGTGIDGLDDVEFYDLVLPGRGNVISYLGTTSEGRPDGRIENCILKAPLNYDGIDSNLELRNNIFEFSEGDKSPAARVYGDSGKSSKETVSNVEVRDNIFYGNGENVAFEIKGTGVNAGIEEGNNSFINWRTVVQVESDEKSGENPDQYFKGNYWEAPVAGKSKYSTEVLIDEGAIKERQVENNSGGEVYVTNFRPASPTRDQDNDGLTDLEEFELGTDSSNPDTDGDGLTDGEEVNQYGTDPFHFDTDLDGVDDGEEVQYGTDPLDEMDFPNIPLSGGWGLTGLAALVGGSGALALKKRNRRRDYR